MLYALDMNPSNPPTSSRYMLDDAGIDLDSVEFAEDLVQGVIENRELIDQKIHEKSKNWSIPRMARVDLNILRMATYELLIRNDIPRNVSINEAIEVAKKFGTEESPAFINGILDEIAADVPDKSNKM